MRRILRAETDASQTHWFFIRFTAVSGTDSGSRRKSFIPPASSFFPIHAAAYNSCKDRRITGGASWKGA